MTNQPVGYYFCRSCTDVTKHLIGPRIICEKCRCTDDELAFRIRSKEQSKGVVKPPSYDKWMKDGKNTTMSMEIMPKTK